MKQMKKKSLLDNPTFTKIFALCVACLCWLAVAMMNVSEYKDVLHNVPVNVEVQAEALAALDLNIIEVSHELVSAEVEGERGAVGNLTPEDLTATIQIPADLVEANVYDLRLIPLNTSDSYTVLNYSPRQVRVRIDRLDRKTFDVAAQVTGAKPASGYILDDEAVSPARVTVTGPSAELERIARVVVREELSQELEKTYAAELPVILLDAQGEVIDPAAHHLTLSSEKVQLVISVLREKELPLDIRITNAPDYFPLSDLDYSMSNYEIMVAGPVDTIARYQEIILAYIDLRTISLENNVFYFDVEMPTETIINLDNINSVTVTFPTNGWAEASFNVNEVELLHKPSRYEVTLLAESVPGVTMCGESELLETMTADDLVAQVDLSERELTPGQYRVPVRIGAPNKGLVWSVGEHFVVIQVSEKE